MSLDATVITKAVDKKYTEFSGTIKTELYNKMSSHPSTVKYAADYDKVQTLKQAFAQINTDPSED
jgi:hypothetical protein